MGWSQDSTYILPAVGATTAGQILASVGTNPAVLLWVDTTVVNSWEQAATVDSGDYIAFGAGGQIPVHSIKRLCLNPGGTPLIVILI